MDDAFVVDIPDVELVFVFGVSALNKNFEVISGGNGFDGIPVGCGGEFGFVFLVF